VASVKRGRAHSLGQGLSSLFGVVFGLFWLYLTRDSDGRLFHIAIAAFIIISAIVGGVFSLYNAFSRRRFSEYDVTHPGSEVDPMDRLLGLSTTGSTRETDRAEAVRKYPGAHCPFCGVEAKGSFDFCPNCGKDI
jgi:hypothetical protein